MRYVMLCNGGELELAVLLEAPLSFCLSLRLGQRIALFVNRLRTGGPRALINDAIAKLQPSLIPRFCWQI